MMMNSEHFQVHAQDFCSDPAVLCIWLSQSEMSGLEAWFLMRSTQVILKCLELGLSTAVPSQAITTLLLHLSLQGSEGLIPISLLYTFESGTMIHFLRSALFALACYLWTDSESFQIEKQMRFYFKGSMI